MKPSTREILYVGSVFAISLLLSRFIWLLPLIIVFPGIIARTVGSPLVYLSLFAVLAELLATTPPGIMTFIVFAPWLGRILFGGAPDLSAAYVVVVAGVVLVQTLVLFAPDVISLAALSSGGLYSAALDVLPWATLFPVIAFNSLLLFGTTILIHFNALYDQRS